MPKAKITFNKIIQDTQTANSEENSEDHMVSRIFFSMEMNGKVYDDMEVEVKQPFGADYRVDPLEVSAPHGSYAGRFKHGEFGDVCEAYYRLALGKMISFGSTTNVRMTNNTIALPMYVEVEMPDDGSDAW